MQSTQYLNGIPFEVEELAHDMLRISRAGDPYSVTVCRSALTRWQAGEYVQDVMVGLSPEQREFLISGYTPDQWKKIFGEEE